MVLKTIYVTRHGFRSNWIVDRETGEYSANIPSPTGIASEVIGKQLPLSVTGYGVEQSKDLAAHLVTLQPPVERFYSSPFYRCVQTINPTLDLLAASSPSLEIYGDNGIGEWYGTARFDHPSPAAPSLMNKLFPRYLTSYKPTIVPSVSGESIDDLHDRTAYALHRIIEDCDKAGVETILLCTHAATLYAIGRALVGRMPEQIDEEDFRPFTCGLSTFVRRTSTPPEAEVKQWAGPESGIPEVKWRDGQGVQGGWDCVVNGNCDFLKGGEERGWRFSGDESFITAPGAKPQELDAGSGLGVVIQGSKKKASPESGAGSRL